MNLHLISGLDENIQNVHQLGTDLRFPGKGIENKQHFLAHPKNLPFIAIRHFHIDMILLSSSFPVNVFLENNGGAGFLPFLSRR